MNQLPRKTAELLFWLLFYFCFMAAKKCLYIAQINVLDAFFEGDLFGLLHGGEGCDGRVHEFVAGEEAGEMEWGSGQSVADKPLAHSSNHLRVVVDAGNQEVGDFYPDFRILHGEDGVEDGLEVATADTLVEAVIEIFEVDVGCVEIGQEVF